MANQIGGVNQSKNGSRAILNFGASKPGNSFIYPCDHDENGDEFMDEFLNQPEKKRRLSMDQVQFLEKCFTADNKLEPDRKIQIAKELGLQPRQITIWFQNRRARWKTRQLETDYEALHRNYEILKTEYDALFSDHQKLKAEVLYLRTNSEPDLQAQGYEDNSRSVIIADEDHDPRGKISRIESKISVMSDVLYEEDSLLAGGLSYTLDPDYPNLIANLDDESMQLGYVFSKVEVSRYLPDGSGFYLEFPNEDPAPGSWSD